MACFLLRPHRFRVKSPVVIEKLDIFMVHTVETGPNLIKRLDA